MSNHSVLRLTPYEKRATDCEHIRRQRWLAAFNMKRDGKSAAEIGDVLGVKRAQVSVLCRKGESEAKRLENRSAGV